MFGFPIQGFPPPYGGWMVGDRWIQPLLSFCESLIRGEEPLGAAGLTSLGPSRAYIRRSQGLRVPLRSSVLPLNPSDGQ